MESGAHCLGVGVSLSGCIRPMLLALHLSGAWVRCQHRIPQRCMRLAQAPALGIIELGTGN